MAGKNEDVGKIIPLFGKDEMNLIEFSLGPVGQSSAKTFEVEYEVFDKRLRRNVTRSLIVTGTDKWGLPRPIDDQVLIGLNTLTLESGYVSQRIEFTRYELCRILGWQIDGRSYARLEESLDRLKATTLKFKDSWFVNSEKEYKSRTFSIIEDVEICSRDQIDRARLKGNATSDTKSSFRWSDVIWKSFQDGFIRTVDMQMFRRISKGRRREVPLRLWRILGKRFHKDQVIAKFKLRRLCVGTLGLSPNYSPAQMLRILKRAVSWLVKCEYLEEMWFRGGRGDIEVFFRKRAARSGIIPRRPRKLETENSIIVNESGTDGVDNLKTWIEWHSEAELYSAETQALADEFGSEFERTIVENERREGKPVGEGRLTRKEYVRRYIEQRSQLLKPAVGEK